MSFALEPFELFNRDGAGLGGDEVSEGVGGVIATDAIFIGIDFQDIFRTVWVVLKCGEGLGQATATFVNEELGRDSSGGISEALKDLRPTVDAIHVGRTEGDALAEVLLGDGGAIALA